MERQLEPPPDRQVFRVAERISFRRRTRARREREEAGAASVAERALERQRAGLAPQFQLDVRRAEVVVVRRQARRAARSAPSVRCSSRRSSRRAARPSGGVALNLQIDAAASRPGAVDAGRRSFAGHVQANRIDVWVAV